MKRTVTISVQTLVLLGVVALVALGVVATTTSSAQTADEQRIIEANRDADAPWVLEPRRCNSGGAYAASCTDDAYLFNPRTGELFLIEGNQKFAIVSGGTGKKK